MKLWENEAVSTLDHGAKKSRQCLVAQESIGVLDLWEVPTFLWFWPSSHWEPPAIFANSPTVFVFQSQNHKNHKRNGGCSYETKETKEIGGAFFENSASKPQRMSGN